MFPLGYSGLRGDADRLHHVSRKRKDGPGLVGRNLKRLREAKKLSQEALGEASGINRTTIAKLERGHQADASVDAMVVPLAKGLGVRPSELLEVPGEALPLEPLIKAFLASPFAAVLKPPIQESELERLRSVPDAFWFGVKATPEVLAKIVEAYRSETKE